MPFGFSEEHAMLRESARKLLAQRFDRAALRKLVDDGADYDQALYDEVAALGWTTLATSFGWLHAALLCEELGRALSPMPIAQAMLAADCFERDEPAALFFGTVFFGTRGVRAASGAQLFIGEHGGKWQIFERDAVEVRPEKVVDPTSPSGTITVTGQGKPIDVDGALLRHKALTLLAAETVGAAETALIMTRDYAIERKQFGRPIGTYQAVSHPIVNVMIAVEQARSLTIAAAAAIDAGDDASTLSLMAKVAASEALWFATSRGVQLHGGYGFTWDCDMHFYFRRALYARSAMGTPDELRRELAQKL